MQSTEPNLWEQPPSAGALSIWGTAGSRKGGRNKANSTGRPWNGGWASTQKPGNVGKQQSQLFERVQIGHRETISARGTVFLRGLRTP